MGLVESNASLRHLTAVYIGTTGSALTPTIFRWIRIQPNSPVWWQQTEVRNSGPFQPTYFFGSEARPVLVSRASRWLRIAKWRRVAACAVHAGGMLYLQTICVCHCRTTLRRGHTAECWVPRQLSDTADKGGQAWGRKRPPVDLLLSSTSHARQLTFSPRTQLSRTSALARVGYGGMYPGRGQM